MGKNSRRKRREGRCGGEVKNADVGVCRGDPCGRPLCMAPLEGSCRRRRLRSGFENVYCHLSVIAPRCHLSSRRGSRCVPLNYAPYGRTVFARGRPRGSPLRDCFLPSRMFLQIRSEIIFERVCGFGFVCALSADGHKIALLRAEARNREKSFQIFDSVVIHNTYI